MKIGYARTSKTDQKLDLQVDALKAAGCEKIFVEQMSGAKKDRPELQKAIASLKSGDTFVVWKLDRLGRSLQHLIQLILDFDAKGVNFVTIQGGIDTTTPSGKLIFHIIGAIAEFERELTKERVVAGLEAARERGKVGGRPKALNKDKLAMARNLIAAGSPKGDVAELLQISTATLYRSLKFS